MLWNTVSQLYCILEQWVLLRALLLFHHLKNYNNLKLQILTYFSSICSIKEIHPRLQFLFILEAKGNMTYKSTTILPHLIFTSISAFKFTLSSGNPQTCQLAETGVGFCWLLSITQSSVKSRAYYNYVFNFVFLFIVKPEFLFYI